MVTGEVIANISSSSLIAEVGKIGLWFQAVGFIVIIWIIFESVILYLNYKRMKEVYKIKDDMKRIEGKLDKVIKNK